MKTHLNRHRAYSWHWWWIYFCYMNIDCIHGVWVYEILCQIFNLIPRAFCLLLYIYFPIKIAWTLKLATLDFCKQNRNMNVWLFLSCQNVWTINFNGLNFIFQTLNRFVINKISGWKQICVRVVVVFSGKISQLWYSRTDASFPRVASNENLGRIYS